MWSFSSNFCWLRSKYLILFIDDYSHTTWIYFLQQKSEAFETFKKFHFMFECQAQSQIGTLQIDNGGEFTSLIFEDYLRQNGVPHHLTIPGTSEQNSVVERMNRTIMNMVRAMLYFKGIKLHFWAEVARTKFYLHNRSPSFSLHQATPYEVWYGYPTSVRHLQIF